MAAETVRTAMARIMGVVAIIASAGCDPGATLLPKDQTHRDATTQEDARRAQVALDVTAIIGGMMLAHGLRVALVQSGPYTDPPFR
jgi:hypothetical protein